MGIPVSRQGDACIPHCSGVAIATGSSDVKVNGRGIARRGDAVIPHLRPGTDFCPPHGSRISSGSSTVFANGRPVARVGSGLSMCTRVAQGSTNVFVG